MHHATDNQLKPVRVAPLKKQKIADRKAHEILSLKVPDVEFDFDGSDCMMQVVTDTSKVGSRIS